MIVGSRFRGTKWNGGTGSDDGDGEGWRKCWLLLLSEEVAKMNQPSPYPLTAKAIPPKHFRGQQNPAKLSSLCHDSGNVCVWKTSQIFLIPHIAETCWGQDSLNSWLLENVALIWKLGASYSDLLWFKKCNSKSPKPTCRNKPWSSFLHSNFTLLCLWAPPLSRDGEGWVGGFLFWFCFHPLANNVSVAEKLSQGKLVTLPSLFPILYTNFLHKDIKAVCIRPRVVKIEVWHAP